MEKSPNDTREYKYFELSNSMKCLVISDVSTDMAAAALDVNIGSLQSPKDIPGLSHFLEHMLFMGTELHPQENYYSSFISKNSGMKNAYTDAEDTNYYFQISAPKLKEALSIFSGFFTCPLLLEDAVDREMKAVHSEHSKNLKSDMRRLLQLTRNSANPAHQLNHFSTGSISTLQRDDIHARLRAFYTEHYSANLMSLVVYGRESTETLQSWVTEHFESVPNRNLNNNLDLNYPFDNLGHLTLVVPVLNKKSMRLFFSLMPLNEYYLSKPDKYVCHLLGHEGKNSLFSVLQDRGLVNELSSSSNLYQAYTSIIINLQLTEKGFELYADVLAITFAYMRKLRDEGPQEWVFHELQQMGLAKFQYKSMINPVRYSHQLAKKMHRIPSQKLLSQPDIFEEFDAAVVSVILDKLTPENCEIHLMSQTFHAQGFETEHIYGTKYRKTKIPDDLLQTINKNIPNLDFPVRNKYIPNDFQIISMHEAPEIAFKSEGVEIWHEADPSFNIDKICGMFTLNVPSIGMHSESLVTAKIWKELWWHSIRQENYLADSAGLVLSSKIGVKGLTLELKGFSQHYDEYLLSVLQSVFSYEINQELYENYKEKQKKKLENFYYSSVPVQARRLAADCLKVTSHFSVSSLLKAIDSLSLEDFLYLSKNMFRNIKITGLIMGNISRTKAHEIAEKVELSIPRALFMRNNSELPILKIAKIPRGLKIIQQFLLDKSNVNSVSIAHWDLGPETNHQVAACQKLFETFLREPCFNTLRTKEQLGYVVSCTPKNLRGVLFVSILVQSSVACPAKLNERVSSFVEHMLQEAELLTGEQFQIIKTAAINKIKKRDVNLDEKFNRYSIVVNNESYWFTKKEDLGSEISQVSLEEFKSAFCKTFASNARRFDVELVCGNFEEEQAAFERNLVENHIEFHRSVKDYPQIYIRS